MAKKHADTAAATPADDQAPPVALRGAPGGPIVRGQAEVVRLDTVIPNPWNPNRMSPQMMQSLRHGLRTDGWIASQALLVWGLDDHGIPRNTIIDGEHRWRAAREEGFATGPVVFLDGVTEAQAKALTIKMNQKRGDFDDALLAVVMQDLQHTLDVDDLGLDLGFRDDDMIKLLAVGADADPLDVADASAAKAEAAAATPTAVAPAQVGNHVRLVQLFFDQHTHVQWQESLSIVAKALGTGNVTDTALGAMRIAAKAVLEAKAEYEAARPNDAPVAPDADQTFVAP